MKLEIELTDREAEALAQFCKRLSLTVCESLSDPTRREEPYDMLDSRAAVRLALAEKGWAPR